MPNNHLTIITELETKVRELEGLLSLERTTVAQLHEEMIAMREQFNDTLSAQRLKIEELARECDRLR